jgi:hypothetical protein
MFMVLAFFKWCEASWLGKGISGSVYLFPVVEAVHLLALAVIGGAVLIVDMRLAGFGLKKQSAAEVAREAEPWLLWSLSVMLISGFMLMTSEAMRCYYNDAFWIKMYSLLGALIFTFTIRRRVAATSNLPGATTKTIVVALISVLLWSGVGLGGRGIGFY